jgi:hypothetical protein
MHRIESVQVMRTYERIERVIGIIMTGMGSLYINIISKCQENQSIIYLIGKS